jgi:hypothetical protein
MIKELCLKKPETKAIVVSEDLKFDGKNLVIPSYWVHSICDFLKQDANLIAEPDRQDFIQFRSFLYDVVEFKNQGN